MKEQSQKNVPAQKVKGMSRQEKKKKTCHGTHD